MSERVNPPKRRYDSSRRKQAARETRNRIVEAARILFTERGFATTTIDAIAGEADVAVETVYSIFRNKRAILAELMDVSVVGDDAPVPLLEREGPQSVQEEEDQHRQVQMFAAGIREILSRTAPIDAIVQNAGAVDPEIAAYRIEEQTKRHHGMTFFVRALAANGPLHDNMPVDRAADIVWTLAAPEVFRLLTVQRGWSADQYEEWLAETLTLVLLP